MEQGEAGMVITTPSPLRELTDAVRHHADACLKAVYGRLDGYLKKLESRHSALASEIRRQRGWGRHAVPPRHRAVVENMRATPYEEHIAACSALLRDWPFDRGRVRPALGPSVPLSCSA